MRAKSVPDKCKGCGAPLGWLYSVNRPREWPNVPVDWDSLHAAEQLALKDGQRVQFRKGLVVHFSTCPKAGQFHKGGKKPNEGQNPRMAQQAQASLTFE